MSDRVAVAAIERSIRFLTGRLEHLESRVQSGDESAWSPYLETVKTLAVVLPNVAPERRGALLTTAQMAERLAISTKTLLKRKARGEIQPVLQRGKLIRWRDRAL